MISKVRSVMRMVRRGQSREVLALLRRRWDSELLSFGLSRDLSVPFTATEPVIPVTVRPLKNSDVAKLLDLNAPGISNEGREERETRLQIVKANVGTCYVAATADDTPCYMQWIIGPAENKKLRKLTYCMGTFPTLKPGEVLVEGAFTPEQFRGQRIMPYAMSLIAEKGLSVGAKRCITFVTQENIASLKGCKRAGFAPYLVRSEKWRFFRKHVTFTPLPPGTPYPFDR